MSSYKERKDIRAKEYNERKGTKQRKCICCNGSGRYDHNGSPPCGACDGTGKEWYKPIDTNLKMV